MIDSLIKKWMKPMGIVVLVIVLSLASFRPGLAINHTSKLIRVGLDEGVSMVSIGVSGSGQGSIQVTNLSTQAISIFNSGQSAVFSSNGQTIDLQGYDQHQGPYLIEGTGSSNVYLSYRDKTYRGTLEVRLSSSGGLTVINQLPIDEYLYGVVPREMPAWFPMEALNAQAVAARTYTYASLGKHSHSGYDLCNTVHCQVYGGVGGEDPRTNDAVNFTSGQVLTHNGKLISAFYHASSGGHTENSENVWSNPLPYIKGVPDFDQAFPRYSWVRSFTPEQMGEMLNNANMNVGIVRKVEPTGGFGVSGRPISIKVTGSSGEVEMRSATFRTSLDLPSTLFTIEQLSSGYNVMTHRLDRNRQVTVMNGNGVKMNKTISDNYILSANGVGKKNAGDPVVINYQAVAAQIKLIGQGWGHGLGMSQWGAYGLAEKGYNYEQILKHYYQGVVLEQRS